MLHPTARNGRMRPAMGGPQTFNVEAYSAEDLAEARTRLGAAGTIYMENYSNIPRSKPSLADTAASLQGQTLSHSASEPSLRMRTAAEILCGSRSSGSPSMRRTGPHWPPTDG